MAVAARQSARQAVGNEDRRDTGRNPQGPRRRLNIGVPKVLESRQEHEEKKIGVALHALARVEYNPVARREIECVAEGNEGVVGKGVEDSLVSQGEAGDESETNRRPPLHPPRARPQIHQEHQTGEYEYQRRPLDSSLSKYLHERCRPLRSKFALSLRSMIDKPSIMPLPPITQLQAGTRQLIFIATLLSYMRQNYRLTKIFPNSHQVWEKIDSSGSGSSR